MPDLGERGYKKAQKSIKNIQKSENLQTTHRTAKSQLKLMQKVNTLFWYDKPTKSHQGSLKRNEKR
jgi:hypothetical protein